MALFARFQRRRTSRQQRKCSQRRLRGMELLEDRSLLSLLGNQLFPSDNPWNQNISAAPVSARSAAIMNSIVSQYGDGRLHPDFGQDSDTSGDLYGIPYNIVHGNSTSRTNIVIDAYPDESDLVGVPIPANVVIEGDFQSGPRPGLDNRGDSHLIIYDVDNNVAYELYRASRPSENGDGRWHADQLSVWDMQTNSFRTLGWTSADAAGLPVLAGLVRPDEVLPVSQGGQGAINHAIRFTLRNQVILDQFVYPASHTANPGNNNPAIQPPMGMRFRLKPGVDLSQLNPQSRVIAQAMQDYGMIVADNGSNFFFSGASRAMDASNQQALTWDDDDIQDTARGLKSLRYSDFEIVDLKPIVTGLNVHLGPAGTVVTVMGQNFSGAAGRLQVLFGNTPATSINVLDDGRVTAVAPPGSGTVDVRVQSGVTTGADPDNINSPIFGYGASAVSAAARFTYGLENSGPTIVTGADAGGSPEVRVFDGTTGGLRFGFLAYAAGFRGGVRVASGDVNGDGTPEIITAPGPGGGPHVRVFDGATGSLIREFFAYHPGFTGGVNVASGDVNGDGRADIITGAGAGGGPHVRVFSGLDGSELFGFFAYSPMFGGGVTVAAGDVNADGRADVITGAGPGGGPHVRIFSGMTQSELFGFFAYHPNFSGGVFVAAGDVNTDGRADIYTGAGAGGGPHVRVISGANQTELHGFFAYHPAFGGGVRVAAADLNNDGRADILTAAGPGGGPHVRVLSGVNRADLTGFFAYDASFSGGVFVAGASAATSGLAMIQAAALARWEEVDLDGDGPAAMQSVPVDSIDLPVNRPGPAPNGSVAIDPTPQFDDESSLADSQAAPDEVDLLAVVLHEIGDLLDLADLTLATSDP